MYPFYILCDDVSYVNISSLPSCINLNLDTSKQVELRFLLSPIKIEANDCDNERVGSVVCERTKLEGGPSQQRPVGTGKREIIPADLVLVSIGYRGMPLEGMEALQLFDSKRGLVANEHGKVIGGNNLFVTGWIKRGPTGIIGTNIQCAKDTIASVMKFIDVELSSLHGSPLKKGRDGLADQLKNDNAQAIDWQQFMKIEASESDPMRLRSDLQPREKLLSVEEMVNAAS